MRFAAGLPNPDYSNARIPTIWGWEMTSNNVLYAMTTGNHLLDLIQLRMSMDSVRQDLRLLDIKAVVPKKLCFAGAIRMIDVE